jgi:hypothetical protein
MTAAVVGVAFGLSTFDRWLSRRRPHEGVWTIAFALFSVAALFMAAGADAGWTQARFRGFYLFGAIVDVPVLALGSMLLLFQDSRRRVSVYVVALFCVFGTGVMVVAPFTGAIAADTLPQGWSHLQRHSSPQEADRDFESPHSQWHLDPRRQRPVQFSLRSDDGVLGFTDDWGQCPFCRISRGDISTQENRC